MKLLRKILNWLFPLYCVGCEKVDSALCLECEKRTLIKEEQECTYCREPSNNGASCEMCLAEARGNLDGLITIFPYEKSGLIAKLLHYYKYDQLEDYGKALISVFQKGMSQWGGWLEEKKAIITWVPMTKKKLRARGFNQSEVLARALGGGELQQVLGKVRESRAQMTLNRKERLMNLRAAFTLLPKKREIIMGRNIVIVDDIATTLATLEEMAGVLKRAGAKQIYGFTVARQKA